MRHTVFGVMAAALIAATAVPADAQTRVPTQQPRGGTQQPQGGSRVPTQQPAYGHGDRDRGHAAYGRHSREAERWNREHEHFHDRLEREHAAWHRHFDRDRRDHEWHRQHDALHQRLDRIHADWHRRMGWQAPGGQGDRGRSYDDWHRSHRRDLRYDRPHGALGALDNRRARGY
jgi:hypothetical protein